MTELKHYPFSEQELKQRIEEYLRNGNPCMGMQETYRFILNCIDLTSLEGSDTPDKIRELCRKAVSFRDDGRGVRPVAAVCVYPPFVALAKEMLAGTGIKVASVAGAFPAGQSPLSVKLAEVGYALEQGADEIDMVISRGKFLDGRYEEVYDEIRAVRDLCKAATLKVILETGELKTPDNIYRASQLAIAAGADFIKTSTGKIAVNATPEAFVVMMDAIKEHFNETGHKVAIKAAGGISDPDTACQYVTLLANVLGQEWLCNERFRFGASRLASRIPTY